jgi:hypothetical protein
MAASREGLERVDAGRPADEVRAQLADRLAVLAGRHGLADVALEARRTAWRSGPSRARTPPGARSPERSPDPQAGEQWQHHRSIAGLARGEQDDQRAATAADCGVDLRAQPAARPAERMIVRFVPAAARILVIRPSHCVLVEPCPILPNNTFGSGRVLMRPHDRGIDRHRPIEPASSVGLGLDHSQQLVPGPVGSETIDRCRAVRPPSTPARYKQRADQRWESPSDP